jgi:hypothetical protein
MKKLFLIILALMLLAGCSKAENTSTKPGGEAKGYAFETKGVTIAMHSEIAPILKSLGKEKDYFEAKSCAFPGLEKTYTYNGFELHTYESNGKDMVAAVIFLDDTVSTKEGIALNSSLNDVIKAYGDKYVKNLGLYTYTKDKSKIAFLVENDKVTSIEYTALAD